MTNPFIPLINSYLSEPEASLLVGMLFGQTAGFSPSFYQALLKTGTIHVVALSGMNLTILINFIARICYPLGRRLASLVSIAAVVGFIFFVGPSPTIVRAGIMAGLSLLAVFFGRQANVFLSLFLAACLMVLFRPAIVKDLSFQLSFLSTLGILVLAGEPLAEKPASSRLAGLTGNLKRISWENLRTTLAAQIATLPIIVFTFGRVSLISPLTNLLTGWVVNWVMILGLFVSLAGWLFYPLGQLIT